MKPFHHSTFFWILLFYCMIPLHESVASVVSTDAYQTNNDTVSASQQQKRKKSKRTKKTKDDDVVLRYGRLNTPTQLPDQSCKFNGSFNDFIERNLGPIPHSVYSRNISGKIYVEFIVTEKGEIHEICVIRGLHSDIDLQAMKAVKKSSGKWIPAKLGEKNISQCRCIPISIQYTNPPRPRAIQDFQQRENEKEETHHFPPSN